MNRFKIEVAELLKKEIFVDAENADKALNLVKDVFMKTNLLDLTIKDLYGTDVKIIEKNGEKVEENEDYFEDDFYENDDEDSCECERDYY